VLALKSALAYEMCHFLTFLFLFLFKHHLKLRSLKMTGIGGGGRMLTRPHPLSLVKSFKGTAEGRCFGDGDGAGWEDLDLPSVPPRRVWPTP